MASRPPMTLLEGARLDLPTDRPRHLRSEDAVRRAAIEMDGARLEGLAARCSTSVASLLLTAFEILLFRTTSQSTFDVGVASSTDLAASSPVHVRLNATDAARVHLARAEKVLAAGGRAESLVEPSVVFAFDTEPHSRLVSTTLSPRVELALVLSDRGPTIAGELLLDGGLFEQSTAERLAARLDTLLDSIANAPDARIGELDVLPESERRQVLAWCRPAVDYPRERALHELVREQSARTPERLAVADAERSFTYAALVDRATALAELLVERGIRRGDIVALVVPRAADAVVAMLGVMFSGAAYLPLDREAPGARLRTMIEDSGAKLIVAGAPVDLSREVVLLDDVPNAPKGHGPPRGGVHDLAYIIYTSGSTGVPKAVAIAHDTLVPFVWEQKDSPGRGPDVRSAQYASLTFDAHVMEIWPALVAGGSVHFVPDAIRADAEAIVEWVVRERIGQIFLPTPIGEQCMRVRWPEEHALDVLLVGGDKLHKVPAGLPFRVVNAYGPTECTVVSTYGEVEPGQAPPIGSAIAGARLYVLDDAFEPVPIGQPGELHVGGALVGRGYLNRPELTAERFVPDPFAETPGARMYRTGDLVKMRADGTLDFLGRIDHQVKVRGFRIELGEIEAAIGRHPTVAEVVVLARHDEVQGNRLVAYMTPRPGRTIDEAALRAELGSHLPAYMIPAAMMVLPSFPVTTNGKIDRAALPEPAWAARTYEAPVGEGEELVARTFAKVLGVARVGAADDFFELGGHSLAAGRVVSLLRAEIGAKLPVRLVFETRTPRALAGALAGAIATGGERSELAQIPRVDRSNPLPLSSQEARLWFVQRLDASAPTYNECAALRVRGALDLPRLARAFAMLAERHEVLRTRFVEGDHGPMRVIDPAPAAVAVTTRTARDADSAEHVLREIARQPFALEREPAFRPIVVTLADDDHVIAMAIHHVVTDEWSSWLLFRDLGTLYEALGRGTSPELPARAFDLSDWIVWSKDHTSKDAVAADVAHFVERLAGVEPVQLTTDRLRPATQSFDGAKLRHVVGPEVRRRLQALANEERTSVAVVLLAALATFVQRSARIDRFAIGMPVAGRPRADLDEVVGFFVNTVAIDFDFSDRPSARTLLRRTREAVLDAQAHADAPFDSVVDAVVRTRDASRPALCQIVFAPQPPDATFAELAGMEARRFDVDMATSKFDLTLFARERADGVDLDLEYATALFEPSSASRMLEHYATLLAELVASPDTRATALPMLDEVERRRVLREWNDTASPFPSTQGLAELVSARCASAPDAIAVEHGTTRLTFGELDRRANRLAHRLRRHGVDRGQLVALFVERTPDMIVAMLAILKAGGAYVPLDPALPPERLAVILEDASPRVVLGEAALVSRLDARGLTVLDLADHASGEADDAPPVAASGEDLAYVMFTSGSTGRPKGASVPQRAIARLVLGTNYVSLGRDDRVAQASNASFDAATFEIWGALLNGARLVILDKDVVIDARRLAEAIRSHALTTLFVTTALFHQIAEIRPDAFAPLRTLMTGGEQMSVASARRILPFKPKRFLNVYGPTETTTFASFHVIDALSDDAKAVPIGRAIANTTLYVLGEDLEPTGIGVPGEIFIGGWGNAHGYWRRPELSAEKFIPDPFDARPGATLYRTGDIGRLLDDGSIEFLGRADHQVKIRGYRIELGEIETVLAAHPDVAETLVVVRDRTQLVAYVALRTAGALAAEALREHLRHKLPDYMIPHAFVFMDALPLNVNGKVDRARLPAPELAATAAYVAPRDEVEAVVCEIFREVLAVPRVGADDDFFELGGHSLLATRVVTAIRQAFSVDVPLRAFFARPTPAALAETVRAGDRSAPLLAIPKLPRGGPLVASFAQERMWFLSRLDPGSTAYNVALAIRLRGALAPGGLALAVEDLVARHESLRTTLTEVDGLPQQVVHTTASVPLEIVEAASVDELRRVVRDEAHRPFDLGALPLLRTKLVRMSADDHVLVLTMHHAMTDGWSLALMLRELGALYAERSGGPRAELPARAIEYADFAAWQRTWMDGSVADEQLAYWSKQLAGAPTAIDLATDFPRPSVRRARGALHRFVLGSDVVDAVDALARSTGSTPFMVLLGAFALLLSRYSGQDDVVLGTPIANRTHKDLEPVVGFFVNTLACRAQLAGARTFREVVARAKETALGAYAHQDVPFERVVAHLNPPRDTSRTPLFQVMFALQNTPAPLAWTGAVTSSLEDVDFEISKFDLSLFLFPNGRTLEATLEFDTDLFLRSTVERMGAHFRTLVDAALARPDAPLAELAFMGDRERHDVLVGFNETAAAYERGCAHHLFERTVARTPNAPAVSMDGEALTYEELDRRANRVARHLRALGVAPGHRVAVSVPRSFDAMIAVLGILKTGAAYVPIDPSYPADRLAFMLDDARPSALVTHATTLEQLAPRGVTVVCLDRDRAKIAEEDDAPLSLELDDRLPCYVIYTSGSTGRPKGVVMAHRPLVNLIEWQDADSPVQRGGKTLQFTPLSFDVSFQELFSTWHCGGELVLVSEDTRRDADQLARLLDERSVERLFLPFVALKNLAEAVAGGGVLPRALRCVVTAGEQLQITPELATMFERLDGCVLHNHYGPSEAHVVSAYTLSGPPTSWPRLPPIGRPIGNTQLYVLDERLEPVPAGVRGELYIGGVCLADGYLERPALTAERFVPDPFSAQPGARLYKTGDVARLRADGEIEYLGRADGQVKIRGFRIELGEIEAILVEHERVRQAVVAVRTNTAGDRVLVAYVLTSDGAPIEGSDLRTWLARTLPDHMLPAAFMVLDAFPLTPSGKVDRKALPEPDLARTTEYVAPRTASEIVVAEVWCDVLRISRVGVDDNFFELGGHSLKATQVIARVRQRTGVELPVRAVFEHPTLAAFASEIDRRTQQQRPEDATLVRTTRDRPLPLSFGESRLWFLDRLAPGDSTYNMPAVYRLRGHVDADALEEALRVIVERHEALRTRYVVSGADPVRVIEPSGPVELERLSFLDVPADARERSLREWLDESARRPFDLEKGPLFRVSLVALDPEEHVLLLDMHHIVSDGWSIGIILRELGELYAAIRQGRPHRLEPVTIQPADHAVWQRRVLSGERMAEQLDYFVRRLANAATLDIPTDHPRRPAESFPGALVDFTLPHHVARGVRELARRSGASVFMVTLAAFELLVSRWSNQRAFAVGIPIAGRSRAEVENTVGFFVNSLPIAADLSGDPTVEELITRTREATLGAYAHQDVPFAMLVAQMQVARDLTRSPVFQVMFSITDMNETFAFDDVAVAPELVHHGTAKFDVSLDLYERGEDLLGTFEYRTDLFDSATIQRMARQFQRVLEGFVARTDVPALTLDILTEEERSDLSRWNATDTPSQDLGRIHEHFDLRALAHPERVALEYGSTHVTYGELRERSNRMARLLASRGVSRGSFVGVCLDRSVDLIVVLLGILKAGAAYLPLDPTYPVDRLAFMVDDIRPSAIVTTTALRPLLESVEEGGLVLLDDIAADLATQSGESFESGVTMDEPVYVIFTSGSTGKPKGAINAHRGVMNRLRFAEGFYGLLPSDKVMYKAPLSFDVSVSEIFLPLVVGATLVVLEPGAHRDPTTIARAITAHGVTSCEFVPSLLTAFVDEPSIAQRCSTLRMVTSSGEALPIELLRRFYEVMPNAQLYNFYGPSETSVDVLAWRCEADALTVPIGRPLANTKAYVLDATLSPVPVGATGELFIGGINVGLGYHNRPELTAERFLPDPFSPVPGRRMYRTGDLCRWRPDGTVEFRGRVDHQIKLRGQRIELGEIEAALREVPGVHDVVVIVREDTPGDQRLVAYLVGEPSTRNAGTLRTALKRKLPPYMIPNSFMYLEQIPLNPSGKVDRKRLPAPDEKGRRSSDYVAPRNELETKMAKIWGELLRVASIGIHDDFFELGGHSLLAAKVVVRVRSDLGMELPLIAIFESPTIAGLVPRLRAANTALPPIAAGPATSRFLPSYSQLIYLEFERAHPGTSSWSNVDAIEVRGPLDVEAFDAAFAALLDRHDVLRGTFRVDAGSETWFELLPKGTHAVAQHDLSALSEDERRAAVQRHADETYRPYDLFGGELVRIRLLRLGPEEHVVLLGYHHIVADQQSVGILESELFELYRAFAVAAPSPLPPLKLRYADYARWQRTELTHEMLVGDIEYWQRHLDGIDRVEPPIPPHAVAAPSRVARVVDEAVSKTAVDTFARAANANRLTVLLSAIAAALGSVTERREVVLPMVVASGRLQSSDLDGVVGQFANRVRIRVSLGELRTLRDVVDAVKPAVFGAQSHQVAPAQWTHDGKTLFPLMVNVIPDPPPPPAEEPPSTTEPSKAISVAYHPVRPSTSDRKFDLAFVMIPIGTELVARIEAAEDLFDDATIARLSERLARILRDGIREPDRALSDLAGE